MEYNHLLELIKTVSESNLTNFHYEEGNVKIHMSSGDVMTAPVFSPNTDVAEGSMLPFCAQGTVEEGTKQQEVLGNATTESVADEKKTLSVNAKTILSPLVGTFYAAPSEDADPFVKVGDRVKKGQIIAIVEAMKLMNEIESEYDGVITEILVDNATGVEYGEALFVVE